MTDLKFRPDFTFGRPNVRRPGCGSVLPTCEEMPGVVAMATDGFFATGTPLCVEASWAHASKRIRGCPETTAGHRCASASDTKNAVICMGADRSWSAD